MYFVFWFFSTNLFKSFNLFDLFEDNEDEEATDLIDGSLLVDVVVVNLVTLSNEELLFVLFKLSLLLNDES
jgi:hypothetical protein